MIILFLHTVLTNLNICHFNKAKTAGWTSTGETETIPGPYISLLGTGFKNHMLGNHRELRHIENTVFYGYPHEYVPCKQINSDTGMQNIPISHIYTDIKIIIKHKRLWGYRKGISNGKAWHDLTWRCGVLWPDCWTKLFYLFIIINRFIMKTTVQWLALSPHSKEVLGWVGLFYSMWSWLHSVSPTVQRHAKIACEC